MDRWLEQCEEKQKEAPLMTLVSEELESPERRRQGNVLGFIVGNKIRYLPHHLAMS